MFNAEHPPDTAWPHAPVHKLAASGTYFVTCSTYLKAHHFRTSLRMGVLHRGLLLFAEKYGWQLEAWAAFSNHYHFVGHSPTGEESAKSLKTLLSHFHTDAAKWINAQDKTPGRQVWYNYRETHLTLPRGYFARLSYTHTNPVKHGLVADARQYPWCSAAWLERTATPAQVKTVLGFKADRLNVPDGYEPSHDW